MLVAKYWRCSYFFARWEARAFRWNKIAGIGRLSNRKALAYQMLKSFILSNVPEYRIIQHIYSTYIAYQD